MADLIATTPGQGATITEVEQYFNSLVKAAQEAGITLPPQTIAGILTAGSVSEAHSIAIDMVGQDVASRAEVLSSYVSRQTVLQGQQIEELEKRARHNLIREAVELAKGSDTLFYEGDVADPDALVFWLNTGQGGAGDIVTWREVDPVKMIQANDLRDAVKKDDHGNDITRIDEAGLGFTLPPEEEDELPPFIGGFDEDYLSNRWVDIPGQPYVYGEPLQMRAGATFRDMDHWNLFGGLAPEVIATWQQQLVEAGYIKDSDTAGLEGVYGGKTPLAMEQAMLEANGNGYDDIGEWLSFKAEQRDRMSDEEKMREAGIRQFVAPAYIAPDYATLAQTVKSVMDQKLGRRAHDWEVKMLASQLDSDFSRQFGVEVAAAESEYAAGNHQLLEEAGLAEGEGPSAGSFRGVSPVDRLAEKLDTLYAPEIETNERVAQTQGNTQLLMRNLAGLEGAI